MKVNLRQLVVFEAVYRLVAGVFYVRLADGLLRFCLDRAGYSYLTMSNMREFFLRPWTAASILLLLVLGAFLIAVETGGILTAYQAAAYSRRIDCAVILRGALGKTWDEIQKKDWQLLPLGMIGTLFMNGWILMRAFSRIRPLDFILDELLAALGVPFLLAVAAVLMMIIGIPSMLVFFACMVEQKRFGDGVRRSRELLAGKWPALLGLLLAVIAIPVSETDSSTGRSSGQDKTETRTAEKTDLEARLEAVLENVEGVGSVQVMLMTGQDEENFYGSGNTEVTGVLIAAEGAGDSVTVQNIQEAVMALFQIEAHKIKIMKMK